MSTKRLNITMNFEVIKKGKKLLQEKKKKKEKKLKHLYSESNLE